MKHSGKAFAAATRMLWLSLFVLLTVLGIGLIARFLGDLIGLLAGTFVVVWAVFVAFTLYFFRDPDPQVPVDPAVIVSPGHGTVDVIDEITEPEIFGGPCRRISIFLSVFNVHVQQAPVAGSVSFLKHTPGEFLNAMDSDCAKHNENVLIGIASSEAPGEKIGVRLITGLIARRIIPWIAPGDSFARGERISLIQFGSRVDLYLPLNTRVEVKLGDKVVGGQSIIARRI